MPGHDIRNLTFAIYVFEHSPNNEHIEYETIQVNNMTKKFRIKNPPFMRVSIDCNLGKDGLDQLNVHIGK